jgi:hypothetical protein
MSTAAEQAEKDRLAAEAEAAKKAKEKPKSPQEVAMERTLRLIKLIEPGMTVEWYEDGSAEHSRPALVVAKGTQALALLAFGTEAPGGVYRRPSGVKWLHDPTLKTAEIGDQGCFDLSPLTKRMFDLLKLSY